MANDIFDADIFDNDIFEIGDPPPPPPTQVRADSSVRSVYNYSSGFRFEQKSGLQKLREKKRGGG